MPFVVVGLEAMPFGDGCIFLCVVCLLVGWIGCLVLIVGCMMYTNPRMGQMICMICMIYSHYMNYHLDLSGQLDRFLMCMV